MYMSHDCHMTLGYYPHPSIPPQPNTISIQKEVAYSPDLKFCSFDIAVNNGNDKSKQYE